MANTVSKFTVKTTVTSKEKVLSTTVSGQSAIVNPTGFYRNNSTEVWNPHSLITTADCDIIDETTPAGADEDGYLAGRQVYADASNSSSGQIITGLTDIECVWIKHSGFGYSRTSDATMDTTNTSAIVTCNDTSVHFRGQWITGSGIPNETWITKITNSTTFVISNAATATATNVTLVTTGATSTENTTDHLEILAGSVGPVITVLAPNEGIFLHTQGHTDSGDYYMQSVDPDDLTNGAADIAVEFICVEAS